MTDITSQQFNAPELPIEAIEQQSGRLSQMYNSAKLSAQWAIVMAEISPLNEVARGSFFVASEVISRNPIVGGLTVGLSTFVIEAAGGIAAAELMDSEKGKNLFEAVNKKSNQLHVPMVNKNINIPMEISLPTKIGCVLMGGTVVGMAIEQREDPTRNKNKNRAYSLATSAWLGGVAGVGALMVSEGIDIGLEDPKTGGLLVGGIVGTIAAGRWMKKKLTRSDTQVLAPEIPELSDVEPTSGVAYQMTSDTEKLTKAAELEQAVWFEEGFGSLDEYEEHIAQSRTFTAFKDEECVGMARLFGGGKLTPPFMELPFDDQSEREQILKECAAGMVEEVGTLAVDKAHRNGITSTHLYRLAYRDARLRGMQKWGVIMEPERVQAMNEMYGFTFKQLGEAIDYQGGACAAHIMDLDEVDQNMSKKFPEIYDWFVSQPLNTK